MSSTCVALQVKFFERRKLDRQLLKLKKVQGQQGGVLTEDQEQQVRQVEADILYVKHFPKTEKYVSLFR